MPQSIFRSTLLALMLVSSIVPAIAGETVLQDSESFDIDLQHTTGVIRDDQLISGSTVITVPASGLPDASDLDAYALAEDGTVYFSTDLTLDLNGLLVSPGDVVRVDSEGMISLEISAAELGIAANVDAITLTDDPTMPLAVSFDTTVELPTSGGSLVVDDEDLAKTNGDFFELLFDGSDAGVGTSADLDGAFLDIETGELRVSFDTSGSLDGVTFDDEDVLAVDLISGSWRLARDGSVEDPNLAAGADLDAYSARIRTALIFADGFESGDTSAW